MKEEEQKYVDSCKKQCTNCGHLEIFHNQHCCLFCKIPDCKCEWEGDFVERTDGK